MLFFLVSRCCYIVFVFFFSLFFFLIRSIDGLIFVVFCVMWMFMLRSSGKKVLGWREGRVHAVAAGIAAVSCGCGIASPPPSGVSTARSAQAGPFVPFVSVCRRVGGGRDGGGGLYLIGEMY